MTRLQGTVPWRSVRAEEGQHSRCRCARRQRCAAPSHLLPSARGCGVAWGVQREIPTGEARERGKGEDGQSRVAGGRVVSEGRCRSKELHRTTVPWWLPYKPRPEAGGEATLGTRWASAGGAAAGCSLHTAAAAPRRSIASETAGRRRGHRHPLPRPARLPRALAPLLPCLQALLPAKLRAACARACAAAAAGPPMAALVPAPGARNEPV